MKIIKISICAECPYFFVDKYGALCTEYERSVKNGGRDTKVNPDTIDPDCPLQDYKEPSEL